MKTYPCHVVGQGGRSTNQAKSGEKRRRKTAKNDNAGCLASRFPRLTRASKLTCKDHPGQISTLSGTSARPLVDKAKRDGKRPGINYGNIRPGLSTRRTRSSCLYGGADQQGCSLFGKSWGTEISILACQACQPAPRSCFSSTSTGLFAHLSSSSADEPDVLFSSPKIDLMLHSSCSASQDTSPSYLGRAPTPRMEEEAVRTEGLATFFHHQPCSEFLAASSSAQPIEFVWVWPVPSCSTEYSVIHRYRVRPRDFDCPPRINQQRRSSSQLHRAARRPAARGTHTLMIR